MQLWDKLLPQTFATLNLLHQSNAVPTVSACQYMRGNVYYNKTQLAPMGYAVQMHKSRDRWCTWVEHYIDGWYLRTSPKHYRCHIIYTKGTQSERISETVFFKTKCMTQPTLTPANNIVKAIANFTNALKGTRNVEGMQEIGLLKQLDKLLNNIPQKLSETSEPPTPTHQEMPESRVEDNIQTTQWEEEITHSVPNTPKKTIATPPPAPRVMEKEKDTCKRNRALLQTILQHSKTNQVRIPQQHQIQLCRSDRLEQAQSIHTKDTGEWLTYCQLIRNPNTKQHGHTQQQTNSGN